MKKGKVCFIELEFESSSSDFMQGNTDPPSDWSKENNDTSQAWLIQRQNIEHFSLKNCVIEYN